MPTKCLFLANKTYILKKKLKMFTVRITGREESPNRMSGIVWFLVQGIWRPICSSGLDQNTAQVVCQELNLAHAVALPQGTFRVDVNHRYVVELNRRKMFIKSIRCTGLEKSLAACSYAIGGCTNKYGTFVSVVCTSHKLSEGNSKLSFCSR